MALSGGRTTLREHRSAGRWLVSAFGHTRYNDVGEGVAPFEAEIVVLVIEHSTVNLEGSTSDPALGVRNVERHHQSQVGKIVY